MKLALLALCLAGCGGKQAASPPTQKVYDCGAAYAACSTGAATTADYVACRAQVDARCLDAGAP